VEGKKLENMSFEQLCRALNEGKKKKRDAEWAEKLIDSGWDLWFIIGGAILCCTVLPGIFLGLVFLLTKPK
jgi:hypothetical protein